MAIFHSCPLLTACLLAVCPFGGHRDAVTCLAYAPDGRTLMTGGDDRTVRFWEARTGKELATLAFPEAAVKAVAFAPDGRIAAAAGHDGTVRLFDAAAGKELHRFPAPARQPDDCPTIRLLAFSADGRTLTACDNDNTTALWDLKARKELRRVKARGKEVAIGLSADGAIVLWVARDEEAPAFAPDRLGLRHAATGREMNSFRGRPNESCHAAVLSPDGKLLAVQAWVEHHSMGFYALSETLRLFEVATGKEVVALETDSPRRAVAFSPDGGSLVTLHQKSLRVAAQNAEVRVWDLATGQERGHFAHHGDAGRAAAFAPDGRVLATAGDDGTVLVWDVASLPPDRRPRAPGLTASALDALWADLAGADAPKAYRAVGRLADAPARAVALLRERLTPAAPVAPERIAALVADLDDDAFTVRERARQDLENLAERAGPALRRALAAKPSAELQRQAEALLALLESDGASPERLRAIRATAVLERVGSPAARRLLEELAKGDPAARLTTEAKASWGRLAKPSRPLSPAQPATGTHAEAQPRAGSVTRRQERSAEAE